MADVTPRKHRVRSGAKLDLGRRDPSGRAAYSGGKEAGQRLTAKLRERLAELQHLLYADGRHRLLIVLQAMDTAGKDSTIRRVLAGVNPQGVRVASFGVPTAAELARDFLWRVHPQVPADGEIVVFNRSHYEDVLVVRVRELVPEARWRARYEHIAAFERLLVAEGTTILKFFLHISFEEQRVRLQERLADPAKRWKFNPGDLEERELWPRYMAAYGEALARTSADDRPWYVIPANEKWYRDLVITATIVEALEALDLRHPDPHPDLDDLVVE